MDILNVILLLAFSMFIVFVAALLFVNAIEYLGYLFKLGSSFVGAILAPLFTSFPEMTIFLVAVFSYGGISGEGIGIGTLFGQPFMASSLSYGLVGLVVLVGYHSKKRTKLGLQVDKSLIIPYVFITVLFPITLVPSFIGGYSKLIFGILFLISYLVYIGLMYRNRTAEAIEEADEAIFCKYIPHPILGSLIQLSVSVVLLYIGSHEMVSNVDVLAQTIGISAMGLALIVIPAATAIPETASALIWGYRGKDTMCIGSLVGEKILYSTFYPGMGLLLTSWALDQHAYMSVGATTVISLILLYYIIKKNIPWYGLCFGLFFFAAYAIMIFIFHI